MSLIIGSIDYSNTNFKYYSDIIDKIRGCRNIRQEVCRNMFPIPQFYQKDIDKIYSYMVLIPKKFNEPIIMNEEEIVNGYNLYNINDLLMDWDVFLSYVKIYLNSNKNDTWENFYEYCNKNCCSEWSKQDRCGECYGGFWITDRANAWSLSRTDNIKGLFELPYPQELIKLTIKIGCNNRMESVRYSNFLCEWIKRMITHLEIIPNKIKKTVLMPITSSIRNNQLNSNVIPLIISYYANIDINLIATLINDFVSRTYFPPLDI